MPGFDERELQWVPQFFQDRHACVTIEVPMLEPVQIQRLATSVRHGARTGIKRRPVSEIIDIVDAAIARLLRHDDPYRQQLDTLLPVITGYDATMVRLGLTEYFKTFRKPQLTRFLAEDFASPAMLDGFQPARKGGYTRAFGPDLLVTVWAGNVPALPLWGLVAGLLVKAGAIGKMASAEPLSAGLFARLLTEIEPSLGPSLAVIWWRGGDGEREQALFAEADAVLAYGSNDSLAALRGHVPVTTRYLPHGHKIGFQVIAREALDTALSLQCVHDAARDIVTYDQHGCYAPQCVFVEEGGALSPRRFARALAHELAVFERRFARRALTVAEANAVASWRHGEELRQLGCDNIEVMGEAAAPWGVVFDGTANTLVASRLNRTVRVIGVGDIHGVIAAIAPHRAYLQSVAVAAAPERLFSLANALGAEGVTRISALGRMSVPEPGWHHDGRFSLLDLVTITEIELAAEQAAERFASYVE